MVYIIMQDDPFEGDVFVDVYGKKEDAEKECIRLAAKYNRDYFVEEREVK